MKSRLAALLAASLVFPPGVFAAPSTGLVKGQVSLDGRALAGLEVTLVDVTTGAIHTARTNETGTFELRLAPGSYVIASRSRGGLSVGRGPTLVNVESGKVAAASMELVAQAAAQQQPAATTGANIGHEPIGCVVENEFPHFEAKIEPAAAVVRARVYFKSVLSDEWYYVEMTQAEGVFTGILPRPTMAASPIQYYLQATTTDFGEGRTPEISAEVVLKNDDCPGDKKVAPVGPPPAGGVTLFSASTGAAAGLPAGFAAGGALLGTGALIAIGAAVLGGAAAAAAAGGDTTTTTTIVPTSSTTPVTTTTLPPALVIGGNCRATTGTEPQPQAQVAASCEVSVNPRSVSSNGSVTITVLPFFSASATSPDQAPPGSDGWEPLVCGYRLVSVVDPSQVTGQRGSQNPIQGLGCGIGSTSCEATAFTIGTLTATTTATFNYEVVFGWKLTDATFALCQADPFCDAEKIRDSCPTVFGGVN